MKYFKILFSTLLLFCLVYTAEAQIVVTSTTSATEHIKSKSIRQKGLVIRPEFGVGLIIGSIYSDEADGLSTHLLCDVDYQFNPYISIGGGIGINFFGNYNVLPIPLFAHLRGYFCNRKWSPYYDIKLGYNISINSSSFSLTGYNYRIMFENVRASGFYGNFGLGMQYKNYDFGFDISLNRIKYVEHVLDIGYDYYREEYNNYKDIAPAFNLKFAYNFQIQKKKK